jgi:mutual gliding-motility protein MglA
MVELNHRDRTIKVKIVYYGPPVGGKTTNLQVLHQHAVAARRGEMISINSAQDRTILFDLLPIKTPGFRGFDLRLQILAVPGQAMYAATRRLVLKGVDSLVFVANSAVDRWEENIQSYREMTQNLLTHHLDPSAMPLVFQYNKRDLPQVMEPEIMDRALNGRRVDTIPAVAVRGEGVLETFACILMRTVQDLARRYSILDIKEGQPAQQWTQQAVMGIFGTTSLHPAVARSPQAKAPPSAAPPPPSAPAPPPLAASPVAPTRPPTTPAAVPSTPSAVPATPSRPAFSSDVESPAGVPMARRPPPAPSVPPPSVPAATGPAAPILAATLSPAADAAPAPPPSAPIRTVVRVAPQNEDAARGSASGPDARANETLVESYAEASAQLGTALGELRDERDLNRKRLDDLHKTLLAAQDILAGRPLAESLEGVLGRMAAVAGVVHASFWVPQPGRPPHAAAILGIADDPVLASASAMRYVLENAARQPKPTMLFGADNLDLGGALEEGGAFSVVLVVPFRTPGGLQGMAALYYTADTARPVPETLAHLGEISRALSVALELAATLKKVKSSERALELALAGTASLRGLEDVVNSLVDLRDRLGEMRGRPDAPPWFLEHFSQLAPSLAGALSSGRSLLAFSRGEIQREPVLVDDLIGDLRSAEVAVRIASGAEMVSGDPALLRVAIRAIVEYVRALAGPSAGVEVRAEAAGGRVLISVGSAASSPGAPPSPSGHVGMGLSLAQRIAELHGGSLTVQSVPGFEDWLVFSLLPA